VEGQLYARQSRSDTDTDSDSHGDAHRNGYPVELLGFIGLVL
jgi:hypothetical protein